MGADMVVVGQADVRLFQIVDSKEAVGLLEDGYVSLDNINNMRPDWFDYWPIRHFLLSEQLDEAAFYGFFSRNFRAKVGLSRSQVADYVRVHSNNSDVVIFSPQPDMGAFFLNVFEQAETFYSGMIAAYESVLRVAGFPVGIKNMVMDSRHIVFSNYFVARPSFWREWLSLNEVLFRLAEDAADPIGAELRVPTNSGSGVHRKVFLQERTASFILSTQKRFRSVRYDAFKTAWSASALSAFPTEAVVSDALKIAFRETGDPEYISAFGSYRQKLFQSQPSPQAAAVAPAAIASVPVVALSLEDCVKAAEVLSLQGRMEEARAVYEGFLASAPSSHSFVGHYNLAIILRDLGRFGEAEAQIRKALELRPDFLMGYLGLAVILEGLQRPLEAIACLESGLVRISGSDDEARGNLIKFYNNIGRIKETIFDCEGAEKALSFSVDIDPLQGDVWHHWIHLRQKQCIWPVLDGRLTRSDLVRYASPLSILSLTDDPAEQLACAQRLASQKVKSFPRMTPVDHRYGHDRLRIGYLSSDLSMHAVSLLTVELFELHNRENVEVHAFCWSKEDGTRFRERVRAAFDHFHLIGHLDDGAAAQLIRDKEIDVLVDLQGLSAKTRPDIIARGPAPIQITWLGYPGTAAIPYNDYVVADDFIMPPELEPFFTEKPLRLPTVFQVSDSQRVFGVDRPRSFYGLPDDAFVFCAFNNSYKITPEMFDCWMRILLQVPGSILWQLEDNKWSRQNLLDRAQAAGVDPSRLVFAGRIDPRDYLTRFQAANLFLDTTPYNAGTTANDALWAGLPLLTYAGRTYVSRMAGSLLRSAGLPELITYNLADYEKTAVHYATHRDELAVLADRLRQCKESGELFNTKRFVGEYEEALLKIFHNP